MKRTLVKICGITRAEDAFAVAGAGADLIGFVFYEKSPRYIEPLEAGRISTAVTGPWPHIERVGVFVDAPVTGILTAIKAARLTMIQLHGSESPGQVEEFREALERAGFGSVAIIKAFRIRDAADIEGSLSYDADYLLFDAFIEGEPGGTGKQFNWELLEGFSAMERLFLSGGIGPENVAEAIRRCHPFGIDASSSMEAEKGIKDKKKIDEFMKQVRMAF